MKNWKEKFVIYFMIGLVLVLFILVLIALEPGKVTIEDVLEPDYKKVTSLFD